MARQIQAKRPVLIVDDDRAILLNIRMALESGAVGNLTTCDDSREVMTILGRQEIDLLLLDLNMPHVSGKDLLPEIREQYPDLPVIIVTGSTEVGLAVDCMKLGVFDYLVKPIEKSKLLATVGRALEIRELRRENTSLRTRLIDGKLDHPEAFEPIVFRDEKMRSVLMYVESIAESHQTVLITGETGVGKELIASAIHAVSGRKGPLVTVNVAGYDENMFSDALFGHLRGAYTGADKDRSGLIERSEGGTLFLDEIGDLKPESQVKLLRLLESREYYPLGSDAPRRTDARIVVATNRDLQRSVDEGTFRKDLYFRLETHHVHIPPLRDRLKDLPSLIDHFVSQAAAELSRPTPTVPADIYLLLKSHPFPGNVRELRSMIFDAVSRQGPGSGAVLPAKFFKTALGHRSLRKPVSTGDDYFLGALQLPTIKEATEKLVAEALKRADGNQSVAARILGITPQALSQRLRRAGDR